MSQTAAPVESFQLSKLHMCKLRQRRSFALAWAENAKSSLEQKSENRQRGPAELDPVT